MKIENWKRLTIGLLMLNLILVSVAAWSFIKYRMVVWDQTSTWGVVASWEGSRRVALQSEPSRAAALLDFITSHPSRRDNSVLTMMMERERTNSIHDIIEYLRMKTGEDLGDDPRKWTKKYYQPGN